MKRKSIKIVLLIVLAFITVLSIFSLNEIVPFKESVIDGISLSMFFKGLETNFESSFGIMPFLLFVITSYFYISISNKDLKQGLNIIAIVFGIVFSLFFIIGQSFNLYQNFSLINFNIIQFFIFVIKLIGYSTITYFGIRFLFIGVEYIKDKDIVKKKSIKLEGFDKHPFLFTFLIIFILWLPSIIIFYPGLLNVDALRQINYYYNYFKWDTLHPIFSTIMYGLFMKIGMALGNSRLGIFIPNFIQVVSAIFIITIIINYFYKITNNKTIRLLLILYFGLIPVWPIHFYTEMKDIFFTTGIMMFVYFLMRINTECKENINKKDYIFLFISVFIIMTFRHNGLHTLLFTIPFLFMLKDNSVKAHVIGIIVIVIITVISFNTSMRIVHLIQLGSKGEMFSIPFQQTGAVVAYHYDELTSEEYEKINKVLNIEEVREYYNPENADYVKARFKEKTSWKDMEEYLITWFKMFFKYPYDYIKASIGLRYGYFDPNKKAVIDGIALNEFGNDDKYNIGKFDLTQPEYLSNGRELLESYAYSTRNTPIGIIYSSGTYTLLLIICLVVLLYNKKVKETLPFIPLLAILIVALLSPINGYVRYILPIKVTMPFLLCYIIYILNERKEVNFYAYEHKGNSKD